MSALGVTASRSRNTMSLARWPEADRSAWIAAIEPGALLGDPGLAAGWAPATQAGAWRAYGRWLQWRTTSQATSTSPSFADLVTPTAIASYVGYLQAMTANSSVV